MTDETEDKLEEDAISGTAKKCGIIMPIASMDGYPESHWKDVRRILASAIEDAGFEAKIVSESDDIGVIHQRIVQNLYDNPMIVCDISGRNANVMFELGLRLAFDKPTILVKDEDTQYSFDTSVIEHLTYPKDLRYHSIENFKLELKERIERTYATYLKDPSTYSTFLKNFGSFKVPEIEEKIVPVDQYIIEELKSIRGNLDQLNSRNIMQKNNVFHEGVRKSVIPLPPIRDINIIFYDPEEARNAELKILKLKEVSNTTVFDGLELRVKFKDFIYVDEVKKLLTSLGIHIGPQKLVNGVLHFDTVPF